MALLSSSLHLLTVLVVCTSSFNNRRLRMRTNLRYTTCVRLYGLSMYSYINIQYMCNNMSERAMVSSSTLASTASYLFNTTFLFYSLFLLFFAFICWTCSSYYLRTRTFLLLLLFRYLFSTSPSYPLLARPPHSIFIFFYSSVHFCNLNSLVSCMNLSDLKQKLLATTLPKR